MHAFAGFIIKCGAAVFVFQPPISISFAAIGQRGVENVAFFGKLVAPVKAARIQNLQLVAFANVALEINIERKQADHVDNQAGGHAAGAGRFINATGDQRIGHEKPVGERPVLVNNVKGKMPRSAQDNALARAGDEVKAGKTPDISVRVGILRPFGEDAHFLARFQATRVKHFL